MSLPAGKTLSKVFSLFVILLIMVCVEKLGMGSFARLGMETAVILGFILLSSFITGQLAEEVKLPKITGYIIAGIIFGPHVFEIMSKENVSQLQLLDNLALGLIALTAGGELKLKKLRDRFKSILMITAFQTTTVFLIMTSLAYVLIKSLSFFGELTNTETIAVAMILGVVSTANSPATVIAIITESKAKGPMTDTVLGVTVIKDVVVIMLFAFILSSSISLMNPNVPFDNSFVLALFLEIALSLLSGVLIGFLIFLYLKYVGTGLVLFVLAVAFLTMEFTQIPIHLGVDFHLSGLLLCMAAGFFVVNFSKEGIRFIHSLERGSLPIYILFFTIAGAALNLPALKTMWFFACIMVICRLGAKFIGTWTGSRIAGDSRKISNHAWMPFIAQAGVTVGLAVIVSQRFPLFGKEITTIILAMLAVNQLIGPPLFKLALNRTGESQK